ncbi:MAG: hypothetical protein PVI23_10105, partial [Maricaulaceae bacterium]
MIRRFLMVLSVIAGFVSAAPAAAQSAVSADAAARALYRAGAYVEAAEMSAQGASADAKAFAAKSYAAAAVLADDFDRANALADAALAQASEAVNADPDDVEARLQLTVALWLDGRRRGDLDAYFRGIPQRSRAVIEGVLADAPSDASGDVSGEAWAHSLLGAWHFEAVRRGGGWARRTLGADLAEGAEAFELAMSLAPDDPVIAVQCGVSYLALDPELYAEPARAAFERALAVVPRDDFEAALQARARVALDLMAQGEMDALAARVDFWVSGPAESEDRAARRP